MEFVEVFLVAFPAKDVLEIIIEMADFQLIFLLLNLAWFLAYQMTK